MFKAGNLTLKMKIEKVENYNVPFFACPVIIPNFGFTCLLRLFYIIFILLFIKIHLIQFWISWTLCRYLLNVRLWWLYHTNITCYMMYSFIKDLGCFIIFPQRKLTLMIDDWLRFMNVKAKSSISGHSFLSIVLVICVVENRKWN